MPKIKKEPLNKEKHQRLFYFEIIGFFLIFFSFLAIARLGTLGLYLNLIIKLLTGDWYFLFIFFGMALGIYFLLMHQAIPLSSLMILGSLLIILGLMILSHFSMHNFVKEYDENHISLTVSLYLDYFKQKNARSMVGGGIIGMFFFYILYYLLSTPGVVIISCCMLILGITFLSKKTLLELFNMIFNILKKILRFFKHLSSKMVKGLRSIDDEYAKRSKKSIPKELIKQNNVEFIKETSNFASDYLKKLKEVFRYSVYQDITISVIITPHLVIYKLTSPKILERIQLEKLLKQAINLNFLLRYDELNKDVYIEVVNPYTRNISASEQLLVNNEVVFGIDDRNELFFLEKSKSSMALFDSSGSYFNYLCVKVNYHHQNIVIYDFDHFFDHLEPYFNVEHDKNEFNLFIDEFTKNNLYKKLYVFIYLGTPNEEIMEKIKYFVMITKQTDTRIIFGMPNLWDLNTRCLESFDYIINFDVFEEKTLKYFGFETGYGLALGQEALVKYEDLIIRIAVGRIKTSEFKEKK